MIVIRRPDLHPGSASPPPVLLLRAPAPQSRTPAGSHMGWRRHHMRGVAGKCHAPARSTAARVSSVGVERTERRVTLYGDCAPVAERGEDPTPRKRPFPLVWLLP